LRKIFFPDYEDKSAICTRRKNRFNGLNEFIFFCQSVANSKVTGMNSKRDIANIYRVWKKIGVESKVKSPA